MNKSLKIEILELLEEMCQGAEHYQTDPDDLSGLNTKYFLDSEQFRRNIQNELKKLDT